MNQAQTNLLTADEKGYYCDKDGNIFSKDGFKLKPYLDNRGYLNFTVRVPRLTDSKIESTSVQVHRFIAYKKFGDLIFDSKICIRHLNNNPIDNSWENLAYGSHTDNMQDKPVDIRTNAAIIASTKTRRFSDSEIEEIRKFHNENKSYKLTMEKFNISSKGSLYYMLKGKYVTIK